MKRLTKERDENRCVVCDVMIGGVLRDGTTCKDLDAHHITPRHELPNGGYSLFNLISLCACCHTEAENFLQGSSTNSDYSPDTLYEQIDSSKSLALKADALKVGVIYLDCHYHPVRCTEVDVFNDDVTGKSMIDDSEPRCCSIRQCAVQVLSEEVAQEWIAAFKEAGERGLMRKAGWQDSAIDDFMMKWR